MMKRLFIVLLTGAGLVAGVFFTLSARAAATPTTTYLPLILKNSPSINPSTDWLSYLNYVRAQGDILPVSENIDWSRGCYLHSKYMVKNNVISHSEDPANSWYTADGNLAAGMSNLAVSTSVSWTDVQAISKWMVGPFHGIGLLDPALLTTGFGSYREADGGYQTGACLDVSRGLASIPSSVSFPIRWPKPGGTLLYPSYTGGEMPDPLTSCPGYTVPSGPPIYLQIGPGNITPNVTAHSFSRGGIPLEHCIFDETNYYNSDSGLRTAGRNALDIRDAVVLMPRSPLTPGLEYTVSITANGSTFTWSFTVASTTKLFEKDDESALFNLNELNEGE